MKYSVQDKLKVKTPQGELELQAGQVITLPNEKAIKLMNEGRIIPIGKYAIKMYSSILDEYLWVVQDSNDWPGLKEKGEPVYDAAEIRELQGRGLTPEELKFVHDMKKVFGGTIQNKECIIKNFKVDKHEKNLR